MSGTPTPLPTPDEHTGNKPVPAAVAMAAIEGSGFLETFDGSPAAPQPWHPEHWAVDFRPDSDPRGPGLSPMHASHGPDCAPPPATHPVSSLPDAAFLCLDHLMTAENAGYGAIYMSPPALLDFSAGEAVLRFDLSTLRGSDRDWVTIVLTPWDDNVQVIESDGSAPRNALTLRMINGPTNTGWKPELTRDGVTTTLAFDAFLNWNSFLTPDAARRDTFELHVSRTHLRFGMPGYNRWWVDTPVDDLGWWDQQHAVVQLNHFSYNPLKACDFDGTCGPTTWHWDNVGISPAVPFSLERATRTDADALAPDLTLAAPAPANASLRFAAWGRAIQFSTDDGATWRTPGLQGRPPEQFSADRLEAYWTAIPQGTQRLLFRGSNGAYAWGVRDVSVWAQGAGAPGTEGTPTWTPTPMPAPTRLPTRTPLPTATPSPLPTSTAAPTPTMSATSTPRAAPSVAPSETPTVPAPVPTSVVVTCALEGHVLTCVLPALVP